MSKEITAPPNETGGILYAIGSYGLWGVLPLYWHMLGSVPPFELSYHRMVWSAVFGVITIIALGRSAEVFAALRRWNVMRALALSAIFIAFNWTLYIYAIAKAELVEASLGYYINPLINVAIGVALLGERMSPLRLVAIALAAVAVLFKALTLGHFPFIALGLAISFAVYGYIRKLTPVAALDGMTIETCILLPVTAGILVFWGITGQGAFTPAHPGTDLLLVLGGPMTALPLILFAAAARRVRLSTLGFLQYLSPSISLLIAVFVLKEPFTSADMTAFGCVWAALVLVAVDGRLRRPAKA
jgi:chloramphenicol-sensitive protein RarD